MRFTVPSGSFGARILQDWTHRNEHHTFGQSHSAGHWKPETGCGAILRKSYNFYGEHHNLASFKSFRSHDCLIFSTEFKEEQNNEIVGNWFPYG